MNRNVYLLMIAQFFSAFADNAILFVTIAIIMQSQRFGDWYVPALQSAFLLAFVFLAPAVGRFADLRPKPAVLLVGTLIKGIGALAIILHLQPLLAYAIIGAGAAVYGPAKYGILPELVGHDRLVKANSWIEGSTILAIVSGTVIGAKVADQSVTAGLYLVLALYALSAIVILFMPKLPARGGAAGPLLTQFLAMIRDFAGSARARFSMLGASLFWAAAGVLRVLLVAWAPATLMLTRTSDIAVLTLFLAIGTILGAALVPGLIPIERLRRARMAAYVMGTLIFALSYIDNLWGTRLTLLAIGIAGGMFVVPVNAALQEIGHQTIGSGGAVAIQSFFENVAMLIAVGAYTYATTAGTAPAVSMLILGVAVILATGVISWHLPPEQRATEPV